MDPQLLIPSPAAEFDFDSTSTSPYATAPSSPNILFPKFFHTDLSPINPAVSFESSEAIHYQKIEDLEEIDMDFAFDFSGQLEPPSISDADQLFDGGIIKPLEPPPAAPPSSTLVPVSYGAINLETFSEALRRTPKMQTLKSSPRGRERTATATRHKPFEPPPPPPPPPSSTLIPVTYEMTNLETFSEALRQTLNPSPRGREQKPTTTRHKSSRSLSPLRISDAKSDDRIQIKVNSMTQSSPFGFTWYNKWNLKNLLLFRSTSEGSAAITRGDGDVKSSSFRSSDGGGGSVGGSSRRMKRKVSAHEIHYTENRAVAAEMRRKTFLPYKSGLLGCLGFSHDIREVSRRR